MWKRVYFDEFFGDFWPSLDQLRPYFLLPPGQRWFFDSGNDGAVLSAGTGEYTGDPVARRAQDKVDFYINGHPTHGVLLFYRRWDGRHQKQQGFYSRGDLTRLNEFVRTLHDDRLSVGLFIPFEQAWNAVKEFIETDGALPTSIAWIASRDLPPEVFPEP
ncbi:MAG: hypothetical protein HXX15_13175 [Rhodopseudomonas sp.]|uniref:Imm1 family immunity protein n=1 Tax=Rhodopseudomonas sp. TaxID=1078 RepID=UPI00184698E9|nr:Imm1 family immunity protein [Rhodopseudomonas sp.]NVN87026.1 hypothetical protein [Rhodopseudomonas sp.]